MNNSIEIYDKQSLSVEDFIKNNAKFPFGIIGNDPKLVIELYKKVNDIVYEARKPNYPEIIVRMIDCDKIRKMSKTDWNQYCDDQTAKLWDAGAVSILTAYKNDVPDRKCELSKYDDIATVGIVGGMMAESTIEYLKRINAQIQQKTNGDHSADIICYSLNFHPINQQINKNTPEDWFDFASILGEKSALLERLGARSVILAANTAHKNFDVIQSKTNVPILHIADATAEQIKQAGIKNVLLLGTIYTMEEDYCKGRLKDAGLNVFVPDRSDRQKISDSIYGPMAAANFFEKANSKDLQERGEYFRIRKMFVDIINKVNKIRPIDAVIWGCTELGGFNIRPGEMRGLKPFDTTQAHIDAAVEFSYFGEKSLPVISKKRVEIPDVNGEYLTDTIQMDLAEEEILTLSSAIVEAYKIEKRKIILPANKTKATIMTFLIMSLISK